MEDPDNPFDFPQDDDFYCRMCDKVLDILEDGICYDCEININVKVNENEIGLSKNDTRFK